MLDNVAFFVDAEPPADDPDLLGIYRGTPLARRGDWWGQGSLPDRITLFQGPLTRMCEDTDDLRDEITVTVVHGSPTASASRRRPSTKAGLGMTQGGQARARPSSTRRSSRPGREPRRTPMMNIHQPTANPRKHTAAAAPRNNGHQLCRLKSP